MLIMAILVLAATSISHTLAAEMTDPPGLPHTLYGILTLKGAPAPNGTQIRVYAGGKLAANLTTPATGGPAGSYRVSVSGTSNDAITFGVDGYEIGQTVLFRAGAVMEVNLSDAAFRYAFDSTNITGANPYTWTARDTSPALEINANGVDLGNTVISIATNQACTNVSPDAVQRCFNISPQFNTSRNATITFYYYTSQIPAGQTCEAMNAYHWMGTDWESLIPDDSYGNNGRSCAQNPYSLRVTGVESFSPFILKNSLPTAVQLRDFSAHSDLSVHYWLIPLLLGLGLFFKICSQLKQSKPSQAYQSERAQDL
ncbi:MAG TPA: hypothetical protein DEH25_16265 [Chloroflexi bacterium]|nr:hypothetical protein [Chloroflexota bacterium]HBY06533.1 hypothetical protein [Chloroflexota bacterium]